MQNTLAISSVDSVRATLDSIPRPIFCKDFGRLIMDRDQVAEIAKGAASNLKEQEVEYRSNMLGLLNKISQDFLDSNPEQVDAAIDRALIGTAQFLGIEQISIYLQSESSSHLQVFYSWKTPDLKSSLLSLELDPDGARENKLGSEIRISLRLHSNLIGEMALASQNSGREWTQTESQVLEMIGRAIVSAINRKNTEQIIADQRAQIIQQAKMSALGEMASGIAHEINNPLAIISLIAQRMTGNLENGKFVVTDLLKSIERIESTGQRISKIVKGLRHFAKDGTGEPLTRVPLALIVKDTLAFCDARFAHYQVKLEVCEIPNDLEILCRSVQISQVLLNLLNNAFDAIESVDDKWVRIEICEHEDQIEIAVTDSGPKIDPSLADKIIQPFFTTKAPGSGTGLGLSISRGIVEQHRGQLFLDLKSPNTCFKVILPKRLAPRASENEYISLSIQA